MPRPVILFSGQWADLPWRSWPRKRASGATRAWSWPAGAITAKCSAPSARTDYCQSKLELLARHDLSAGVVSNHRVGQAVCDPIDARHQALLPDYVWGDGQAGGSAATGGRGDDGQRQVAQKLGVAVLSGFTGSAIWSYVAGYPAPSAEVVAEGFRDFAHKWDPILDVCRDCGIKLASEVHPGQIAFDLYSAERRWMPWAAGRNSASPSTPAICTGRASIPSSSCAAFPIASIMSTSRTRS